MNCGAEVHVTERRKENAESHGEQHLSEHQTNGHVWDTLLSENIVQCVCVCEGIFYFHSNSPINLL